MIGTDGQMTDCAMEKCASYRNR